MKTITILFSMLTLLAFNGYSQNTDVKGLLGNQETRTVIFNAIAGDHELMMDFMKVARQNEHGAMMMRNAGNSQMGEMEAKKGGMMEMNDNHQMMGMMKENPEMMQKMMGNMMDMCVQDSAMRSNMADMMAEHPKMMKEKGMMGSDGKVKMMHPGKESGEKEEHEHNH
jgi:hypothetical protein